VSQLKNKDDKLIGQAPDNRGHFGIYGGKFVAETLMVPLQELQDAYDKYLDDPDFIAELDADLQNYVGRPSPLYLAEGWTRHLGGAQIYLKREDLNHTGAHKVPKPVRVSTVLPQPLLLRGWG